MVCPVIRKEFWEEVEEYMETFGLNAENSEAFWLGGVINGEVTSKEHAGVYEPWHGGHYTRK